MNVRRSIALVAAAAALTLVATEAGLADSTPPSPAPAPATTTTTATGGDRAAARKQAFEERRQRLEQLKQQLEQRRQELQQQLEARKQALEEQRQQLQQQRQGAGDRLAAILGKLAGGQTGGKDAAPSQRQGRVLYRFRGELQSVSSTAVSLTVEGGNHAALRKLIGASVDATFAVGPNTEFLLWQDGVPKVVAAGDLAKGDWVVVAIRGPRDASLDELESAPAAIVSDRVTEPEPSDQPAYVFRGKVVSAGATSVTVSVAGGNDRALRLLVGEDAEQSFAIDGETIVLDWQGKVPTVIAAADLKPGERVTVRVRADAGTSLSEVEQTPAARVGEHERAAKD